MIPAALKYVEADSADSAIAALSEYGDEAKLMAGGHSLIPLMRFRLAAPAVIVDISRLGGLSDINDAGDYVSIGALAKHREVETSEMLSEHAPLLAHVASKVGDPQVRHRGTLGGSLAHGDPASDLPAAVLALGGSIVAKGPDGERVIGAEDFFTGFLETAISETEIITEVRIPKTGGGGWSFQKFNRRAQDWAIVGVAAQLGDTSRVSLINMGPTPMRSSAVEAALASGASSTDAADVAAEGASAPSDLNGDAEYRNHLARVLVGRALSEAAA